MPWPRDVPGHRDVGGGEAQAGATLGTANNLPGDAPIAAQTFGGALDVALRQLQANAARRDDFACVRDGGKDGDAEAQFLAGAPHEIGCALAAGAVEEIVADDDVADAKRLHEHAGDEIFGR
jgi:hypothetical protein